METLLLDADAVRTGADTTDVVAAVAAAFGAYDRGDTVMPAKSYVDLPEYGGDFRSMPAYVDARGGSGPAGWDAAAVKWVNVHPENPDSFDLPTVMGVVIYSDPETAFPLAILDGTELTRRRTGAAAAVATDHLAIQDATSLGIVGAGVQSYAQVEAISSVRPIERLVASDLDEDALDAFVERFADDYEVVTGSVADAAGCDVLSTLTPVRQPIVHRDAVGPETHVNAVGADAAGKQELDPQILRDARLVIDDYEQCTHSGEINVPWGEGTIDDADIHGELGAVVRGRLPGREDDTGITVFDSTGLAIQDVAAAHVAYEWARETGAGTSFDLLGLGDRSRPRDGGD